MGLAGLDKAHAAPYDAGASGQHAGAARSGLVVCLCAAAVALAGEGAAPAKPKFLVVVQDKAALNYENTQVGEVVEGTRLEVR